MVENKTSVDELILKASTKIGVDEATTRKCIGAILAFLKQHVTRFDFSKIYSSIEGVEALIKDAEDDDEIPGIPKPAPGIPTSKSEGAAPAAGSEPVTPTEPNNSAPASTGSGIFNLIVTLMKIFGVFALLKQILSSVFGESAVKLIESIEDGAELTQVLSSLEINREQGIRMVRMLVDFMKEKLDSDTIDSLVDEVPAVKFFWARARKRIEEESV